MGDESADMKAVPMTGDSGSRLGSLLDKSPEFVIMQTRKGCLQECFGCDANSQFKFFNGHAGSENDGGKKFADTADAMIEEESSCCIRFFCSGSRPWTTRMYEGPGLPGDGQGALMAEFERPFRCNLGNCKCCCYQEVMVRSGSDGKNEDWGNVREACWYCIPSFMVNTKLEGGEHRYDIHMPTCMGGMCVNCCAQGCCNCRIPFYIYKAGAGEEGILYAPGAAKYPNCKTEHPEAQITKIWSGMYNEFLTDADKFEIKCPDGADTGDKARLIAATLMLNQVFFEKQKDNDSS